VDVLDPFWNWEGWRAITIGACAVGLVAALAFVVAYQMKVGWSWWRNPDGTPNRFGRFLMTRKLLLAILFILILSNRITPEWAARPFVTATLMVLFALQTFVPYRLLMKVQDRTTPEKLEAP
jgi:hypothetical protein